METINTGSRRARASPARADMGGNSAAGLTGSADIIHGGHGVYASLRQLILVRSSSGTPASRCSTGRTVFSRSRCCWHSVGVFFEWNYWSVTTPSVTMRGLRTTRTTGFDFQHSPERINSTHRINRGGRVCTVNTLRSFYYIFIISLFPSILKDIISEKDHHWTATTGTGHNPFPAEGLSVLTPHILWKETAASTQAC